MPVEEWSKMSASKKKEDRERPKTPSSTPPVTGSTRSPIGETKPPRIWRSNRADALHAGSTPRVAQQVMAEESSPPAGSSAPHLQSAPASVQPAPPVQQRTAGDTGSDLPGRYGVDRLVVLVRDPYWVYAWWELTDSTLGGGRTDLGIDADLVLRMYDISAIDWDGTNHHAHFDIEIADQAGNWYIELGKPGGSFVGEVGLRAPDGRFLALLRSNFVTLPRDSMSSVVDEEWMVVEEDYRMLFELAGGGSIGLGSGEFQRMLEQRLRSELSSGGVGSFGISSFGVSRPETSRSSKP
jgi:hypothetical protein